MKILHKKLDSTVIFAAFTDRGYSIPKRILWVIGMVILYGILDTLEIFLGPALSNVVRTYSIVILAMQRSKLFVEPVEAIEIGKTQIETSSS